MHFILSAAALFLFVACHADIEEMTCLHGKNEAAAIADLGPPSFSKVMVLGRGTPLGEFYVGIYNTYDPADPLTEGVEIKELRWDREGFTQGVFMHKVDGVWTVLESCRWKDGVRF
jgi:hypothetical protein